MRIAVALGTVTLSLALPFSAEAHYRQKLFAERQFVPPPSFGGSAEPSLIPHGEEDVDEADNARRTVRLFIDRTKMQFLIVL